MHHMDEKMRRCIDACLDCHRVCVTEASQHCLDVGGRHVEPRHMRLMLACAEICRTSAYFMELGTEFHKRTCAVCADVCEECANDCEQVGDMPLWVRIGIHWGAPRRRGDDIIGRLGGDEFLVVVGPGPEDVRATVTDDVRAAVRAELSAAVARQIEARGERPFLHAWRSNTAAIALHQSMGFSLRREFVLTVLERG